MPPANPNSIKIRFAIRFLRAMRKLNSNNSSRSSSSSSRSNLPTMSNKYRRYQSIRAAACAAMASAVGPRRAWSRDLLRRIRARTLHQFLTNRNQCRSRTRRNPSREEDLRELVPGGKAMDSCSLLTETAHYIKCLRAQVQVMTTVLNHYSTSIK